MNSVSEKGSEFIQDLSDAARKNPLSAALIGMGVLWLFAGSRPVERVGDFARSAGFDRIPDAAGNLVDNARSALRSGTDAVGNSVASAKEFVKDGVTNVTRSGQDYTDAAAEYVGSVSGSGVELLDTVRSNLTDLFKSQPLALGAIGVAIGAGIAAALPATEIETDYLGKTSETVTNKIAEFAVDQADRATTVAEKVVDAVKEEAVRQGLTVEGAKAAAGDISTKVSRVVDASAKSISDRAPLGKS